MKLKRTCKKEQKRNSMTLKKSYRFFLENSMPKPLNTDLSIWGKTGRERL